MGLKIRDLCFLLDDRPEKSVETLRILRGVCCWVEAMGDTFRRLAERPEAVVPAAKVVAAAAATMPAEPVMVVSTKDTSCVIMSTL